MRGFFCFCRSAFFLSLKRGFGWQGLFPGMGIQEARKCPERGREGKKRCRYGAEWWRKWNRTMVWGVADKESAPKTSRGFWKRWRSFSSTLLMREEKCADTGRFFSSFLLKWNGKRNGFWRVMRWLVMEYAQRGALRIPNFQSAPSRRRKNGFSRLLFVNLLLLSFCQRAFADAACCSAS